MFYMYWANFNYFFLNLAIRAIPFHKKNVRMCRKNKIQVQTIKINFPKKNLAMWYIERGFGNVVCSCNFVICTIKYTYTCALSTGSN